MMFFKKAFALILIGFIGIAELPATTTNNSKGLENSVSIIGRAISNASGEPLIGATVALVGSTYGTLSDSNGRFTLKDLQPGKHTVRVSYIGYKTTQKSFELTSSKKEIKEIEFALEEAAFDMQAIVVTASRREMMLKNTPQLTEVISGKVLEHTGAVTVQDALEMNLPGIEFSQDAHGSNLQMQGLDNKYVLILLDGERLSQADRNNIDFNRLNVSQIERIEVTKGAASSLYGSNAIGGVINIITKMPKHPVEANGSYRISKYGEENLNGSVGINSGSWSAILTADSKKSNGYDLTPETPSSYTQEKFEDYSVTPKVRFTPSNNLVIDFKGNYYQYERFDASSTPQHPKNYSFAYGSNAQYFLSPNQSFRLSWHSDQYEQYTVYERLNREALSAIHRYDEAKLISNTQLSSNHNLTLGSEYLREKLVSGRILSGKKHTTNWNVFLQDELKPLKKLTTVVGMQFNHHSSFGLHISPRVSMLYQSLPFNIRLGYSNGFRAPTLKELYMDWDHNGMFDIKGSPDLKPETSNYYSASVEMITTRLNASFSLYHNNLKNMITTVSSTADGESLETYKNVSDARLQGIDLLLKYDFGNGFALNGGYSFVDSEDLSTGFEVSGIIKHTARIRAEYQNRFSNGFDYALSLQAKYSDGKCYEEENENGEIEKDTYKPYWNWRLTAMQTFYNNFSLTLGVDNIFDYTDTQDLSTLTPGRRFFTIVNFSFN